MLTNDNISAVNVFFTHYLVQMLFNMLKLLCPL